MKKRDKVNKLSQDIIDTANKNKDFALIVYTDYESDDFFADSNINNIESDEDKLSYIVTIMDVIKYLLCDEKGFGMRQDIVEEYIVNTDNLTSILGAVKVRRPDLN